MAHAFADLLLPQNRIFNFDSFYIVEGTASHENVSSIMPYIILPSQSYSAFATFSGDQRTILISNLSSGVDSYKISTRSSGGQFHGSKSFVTPASLYAPIRVSTAKQGIYVVTGSEIGIVRIFDSRTGAVAGQLKHQQCVSSLFIGYHLIYSIAL